jgi:hypothetical protein
MMIMKAHSGMLNFTAKVIAKLGYLNKDDDGAVKAYCDEIFAWFNQQTETGKLAVMKVVIEGDMTIQCVLIRSPMEGPITAALASWLADKTAGRPPPTYPMSMSLSGPSAAPLELRNITAEDLTFDKQVRGVEIVHKFIHPSLPFPPAGFEGTAPPTEDQLQRGSFQQHC